MEGQEQTTLGSGQVATSGESGGVGASTQQQSVDVSGGSGGSPAKVKKTQIQIGDHVYEKEDVLSKGVPLRDKEGKVSHISYRDAVQRLGDYDRMLQESRSYREKVSEMAKRRAELRDEEMKRRADERSKQMKSGYSGELLQNEFYDEYLKERGFEEDEIKSLKEGWLKEHQFMNSDMTEHEKENFDLKRKMALQEMQARREHIERRQRHITATKETSTRLIKDSLAKLGYKVNKDLMREVLSTMQRNLNTHQHVWGKGGSFESVVQDTINSRVSLMQGMMRSNPKAFGHFMPNSLYAQKKSDEISKIKSAGHPSNSVPKVVKEKKVEKVKEKVVPQAEYRSDDPVAF